jgi:deoxycytidine triphosphate deaminase
MKDRFDISPEEAEEKFKKYKSFDPFPDVQPALLNSADILDYVAETAMIYPFHKDEVKSASYEVSLLGEIILWDQNNKKQFFNIQKDEVFILKKNSIAFVTPEPIFRIPDYIALRFNLKITHVHRGLLLGTGPLIDPGYEGKLLIPLHNLTNNDYRFKGGEGLIWIEFTKISENKIWTKTSKTGEDSRRIGEYVPFPERKKNQTPENCIAKALKGQNCDSIPSSIPIALQEAKNSAENSLEEAKATAKIAESIRTRFTILGVITVLAVLVALTGVVVAVYQSFTGVTSLINETNSTVKNLQSDFDQKINAHNNELTKIPLAQQEIQALRKEIEALKKEMKNIARPKQTQNITPLPDK